MPEIKGAVLKLVMPKLDWKHYGDDKYPDFWMEVALDREDFMYMRGPDSVMETIKQMANSQGRSAVERIFSREGAVEIGRRQGLTYFRGPKNAMLKVIKLAKDGGPGPLLRLFMEV